MSKSAHQSPVIESHSFLHDDQQETAYVAKERARKKVHQLLQTIRLETENYAKTMASQIRVVAYVNGVLTKTTPLLYEGMSMS